MSGCSPSATPPSWHRRLHHRPCRQGLGLDAGARHPRRHRGRRRCSAGFGWLAIRRQGIYFAMVTLALAQMVYFVASQAQVHRRRGRHPGGAARHLFGAHRSQRAARDVLFRAGRLPGRLRHHLPHHPFALRPGAEGDPRERAARHLAGLQDRALQARSPSSSRRRWPGSPARPSRWSFQLASLTDVDWTMSGEVVLMTLARRPRHRLRAGGRRASST